MKRHRAAAKEAAARETARRLSGGDRIVEEILLWNIVFRGGGSPDEPRVIDGVKFWVVGRNASHDFYAGTDGTGKRFRRSVGESCTVDIDGNPLAEDGIPGIDEHMSEVSDFRGYYGHF